MTDMTDYLEKKLVDHSLGITSYTKPTADYLSLHTASPGDTGAQTDEVTEGGYARQEITSVMTAAGATSGQSDNDTAITFGPASESWGTITYVGIEDASTTGNMLLYGNLETSKAIGTDDSLQFAIGQLAVTFA